MHASTILRSSAIGWSLAITVSLASPFPSLCRGDGKIIPPREYAGSLEERAQEAILIYTNDGEDQGIEDLILKIAVSGNPRDFAWVIPFPTKPEISREDPQLFHELFRYVAQRQRTHGVASAGKDAAKPAAEGKVEVLSRQTVGEFEIAVVREEEAGGLNPWLEREGYQKLVEADGVLEFYRRKGYVFACIKVRREAKEGGFESHPLRFRFPLPGRDGIFFPMRLTGLQERPFDVNLYVFYRAWINDSRNAFGYESRGFQLKYRDWDSPQCEANAGKLWSSPESDPFLRRSAGSLPTVAGLFKKLHPQEKFYLTNIQANGLRPEDVRRWSDDLWLFPFYIDREMVPYDARPGGPAADAFPEAVRLLGYSGSGEGDGSENGSEYEGNLPRHFSRGSQITIGLALAALGGTCLIVGWRRRSIAAYVKSL